MNPMYFTNEPSTGTNKCKKKNMEVELVFLTLNFFPKVFQPNSCSTLTPVLVRIRLIENFFGFGPWQTQVFE